MDRVALRASRQIRTTASGQSGRAERGQTEGNCTEGKPLEAGHANQSGSRKKRGASVASPLPLSASAGGARHPDAKRKGGARNGRRAEAPSLARRGATNPRRGQDADVGRDGECVAPPLVEPMNICKSGTRYRRAP